jgi:hypothetical protein
MPNSTETKIARLQAGSLDLSQNSPVTGSTPANALDPFGAEITTLFKYGQLQLNTYTQSVIDPWTGNKIKRILPRPIFTDPSFGAGDFTPASSIGYQGQDSTVFADFWPLSFLTPTIVRNTSSIKTSIYFGPYGNIASNVFELGITGTGYANRMINYGGTEFYDGVNYYYVLSDGYNRPYYIDLSGVATQITDTDCPSGGSNYISPYIVYMDGALFVAKDNSIHNSQFGNINDWPGYFRTKEQYPEKILALAKHHNGIVAFSPGSIEVFFNAGYSGTSPLNRQESYASKVGMVDTDGFGAKHVVVNEDLYFIGQSRNGDRGLFRMKDFKISKVSDGLIDKVIIEYLIHGGNIGLAYLNWQGTPFVVINCRKFFGNTSSPPTDGVGIRQVDTCEPTLMYNIQENNWSIWTARNHSVIGTKSYNFDTSTGNIYLQAFPFSFYYTDRDGQSYGMHAESDEWTYLYDCTTPARYHADWPADEGGTYNYPNDFLIRTPTSDFGSAKYKHLKRLFFINWENKENTTQPNASVYVWNSSFKELTGQTYPGTILTTTYDDSLITNLSSGRKFIVEVQWEGGYWSSLDSMEFHYIEGEQ